MEYNNQTQGRMNPSSGEITTSKSLRSMQHHIDAQNMQQYIEERLETELAEARKAANIKSGFYNLDLWTDIGPGMYVVGAISSLGKTTFVHQMCDQMAQDGAHVIYFNLEQTMLEMVTKSLAREIVKVNGTENAVSAYEIRKNEVDERVRSAITKYAEYAQRITIAQCSFDTIVDDILLYVRQYIAENECKPIVVVDYLQVIQNADTHQSTRDAVDENVRALKQLQCDYNLVMIVISALNRANYMSVVDYESFKESGGIEYTADVLWGLQLEVLRDKVFETATTNKRRELVKEAKAAIPRRIELVCVKNRPGISGYSCHFDYYPNADYFMPRLTTEDYSIMEKRGNSDDLKGELPF